MSMYIPIPPLEDRVRQDEQAVRALHEIKKRVHHLHKAPKLFDLEKALGVPDKSFSPSVHMLLNAGLVEKKSPSDRMHLTRKGWEFLGETPPIWMEI